MEIEFEFLARKNQEFKLCLVRYVVLDVIFLHHLREYSIGYLYLGGVDVNILYLSPSPSGDVYVRQQQFRALMLRGVALQNQ